MKKSALLLAFLLLLVAAESYGQSDYVFVPFNAGNYRYQFVTSKAAGSSTFMTPVFADESSWPVGLGAFGTLNNTKSPPCPLNDTIHVKTFWVNSRDLLLRKHITLGPYDQNLRVRLALDNGSKVYFNGNYVGSFANNNCAAEGATPGSVLGDTVFTISNSFLKAGGGDNVLAIQGIWLSSKSYLDVQVTGQHYATLTTSVAPGGTGTVASSPAGTVVSTSPDRQVYPLGTAVRLTAYAPSGYYFTGWSGDSPAGMGSANPLDLTLDGDRSLTANFAALPAVQVFPVTNFTDAGSGSLRDAIAQANGKPGNDVIRFVTTGPQTVPLSSSLPVLREGVTIEGPLGPAGEPLVTLAPAATFNASGLQLSGVFLSWGYYPQRTVIRGLKITGFPGSGISIGSDYNTIQQNWIYGNGGNGIAILDGSGNIIGDDISTLLPPSGALQQGFGNRIFGNDSGGVAIRHADPSRGLPAGNSILGNSIYSNKVLALDLAAPGVTENSYPASPSAVQPRPATAPGVNYRQNFPVLSYASVYGENGQPSRVQGSLTSWPSHTFLVQIYLNDSLDASAYGQGKTLIGSGWVTTNSAGNAGFDIQVNARLEAYQWISATATDAEGNTSEFSSDLPVGVRFKYYGDHFVVNTTLSGVPLHWAGAKGKYNMSPSAGASPFAGDIRTAFRTWNAAGGTSLGYTEALPSAATERWGGVPDGINNIVWVPSNWAGATGGADPSALAVTRVRYNAVNGEILDADVAFNAEMYSFYTRDIGTQDPDTVATVSGDQRVDVGNVGVHEFGHFGGLADIYDFGYAGYVWQMGTGNQDVTMNGLIKYTEVKKRSLGAPDNNGIAYIYNNIPPGHVELVLVIDGSAAFQGRYGAFDEAKSSAIALVHQMRIGDRVGVVQLPGTNVLSGMGGLVTIGGTATMDSVGARISALAPGGSTLYVPALQAAQSILGGAQPDFGRAVILLSAGEASDSLQALNDAVPALGGIRLFTLGFNGSTGQQFGSRLASLTQGAYYLADSASIGQAVAQMWSKLSGVQLIVSSSMPSNGDGSATFWYGYPWQPGIPWQPGYPWQPALIDTGTTTMVPQTTWQGSYGMVALLLPGFPFPLGDGPNEGVITPVNLNDSRYLGTYFSKIEYVQGTMQNPTSYYVVTNPKPGKWHVLTVGDFSNSQSVPEVITTSVLAITDVTMEVTFDRSNYLTGDKVLVKAVLSRGGVLQGNEHLAGGGPIMGALVVAKIALPQSPDSVTVTLSDRGAGVYTGVFDRTAVAGTYPFVVRAQKNDAAAGLVFDRQIRQSVYVGPPPPSVLFATNSITIQDSARILSGSIVVNNIGTGTPGDPNNDLVIGQNVRTPVLNWIKAPRIKAFTSATLAGQLFYRSLTLLNPDSTVGSQKTGTLDLPVAAPPTFPGPFTAGTQNITLSNGQSMALAPGSYGAVELSPKAVLTLSGAGSYTFQSLWVHTNASLLFAASPITIQIVDGFSVENGTFTGPASSAVNASQVVFYVAGSGSSRFPNTVTLGPQAVVAANFYVPNGTFWVNNNSSVTGAFLAKNILVGKNASVAIQSSFPMLSKTEEAAEVRAVEVPVAYTLAQNFPNPFNPSTVIRYALPEAGQVTLTVYNILGQEVVRLVDGYQPAGLYEVRWNATGGSGLPVSSGVYFYRIHAGTFTDLKRMILLK